MVIIPTSQQRAAQNKMTCNLCSHTYYSDIVYWHVLLFLDKSVAAVVVRKMSTVLFLTLVNLLSKKPDGKEKILVAASIM